MHHFLINDEAFPYLAVQKGNLSDHLYDKNFWQVQYDRDIHNTLLNIEQFIPKDIDSVLDIGAGLGGINAAIKQKFSPDDADFCVGILDGEEYPAHVEKHAKPFSSFQATKSFLTDNGVENIEFFEADKYNSDYIRNRAGKLITLGYSNRPYIAPAPFDLIVSFQAWCFHFPPDDYMHFVNDAIKPGRTVLILDVRAEKPEWVMQLVKAFGPFEVIHKRPKYSRMVFKPQ